MTRVDDVKVSVAVLKDRYGDDLLDLQFASFGYSSTRITLSIEAAMILVRKVGEVLFEREMNARDKAAEVDAAEVDAALEAVALEAVAVEAVAVEAVAVEAVALSRPTPVSSGRCWRG